MKALVTGGSGFIGSHAVRALLRAGWTVTNLDALTYAANPANLADVSTQPAYRFVRGDVCDGSLVEALIGEADLVLHFAAESHVDRSLLGPRTFVRTDVEGVVTILEAVRQHSQTRLVHMSTDEVFGSVRAPREAREDDPFAPSSPYSASKAGAELQVRAFARAYGLSATIVRACNIYGPHQHVEKFIPLFITRALADEPLPLYGDGLQEREWMYVDDLVRALLVVIGQPPSPELRVFHVGSRERVRNIDVARTICELTERDPGLVTPVSDRPGHDRRYALDSSRLRTLGWQPSVTLFDGLSRTVEWYRERRENWEPTAESAAFAGYFAQQYGDRLRTGVRGQQ